MCVCVGGGSHDIVQDGLSVCSFQLLWEECGEDHSAHPRTAASALTPADSGPLHYSSQPHLPQTLDPCTTHHSHTSLRLWTPALLITATPPSDSGPLHYSSQPHLPQTLDPCTTHHSHTSLRLWTPALLIIATPPSDSGSLHYSSQPHLPHCYIPSS